MKTTIETKTIMYKGVAKIEATSDGRILQDGIELQQHFLGQNKKYMFVNARTCAGSRKTVLVNVARAICQAFNECDGFENLQVDHIDCNPHNNDASNLRFVTQKFNNSREHANKLRAANATCTARNNQILKAVDTKTLQTLYFDNAKDAAKHFGCCKQSIYLRAAQSAGRIWWTWKLSWIPRDSEECKEFVEQIEEEKRQKKMKMIEEQLARREKQKQMKIAAKKAAREKIDKLFQELQHREALNNRLEVCINQMKKRLETWTNHKSTNPDKKNQKIREISRILRTLEEQQKKIAED